MFSKCPAALEVKMGKDLIIVQIDKDGKVDRVNKAAADNSVELFNPRLLLY